MPFLSSFFTPARLFFLIVLPSYLFFGLSHIDQFITADEHYWVSERIPQYFDAIAHQKWKKTFINDKPGVSLALISGIGTFFYPESETHCQEEKNRIISCKTNETRGLYLAFRLPILIINALLLCILFFLIKRLTDPFVALMTTTLTGLSPILLGISQIINPDALLWSYSTVAIFSYFSLLYFEQKKYLILTIIFTTFAILSKYVALILLPFFLSITIFRFLSTNTTPDALQKLLKKDLLLLSIITIGILSLTCFFLPAFLVDSKYITEFIMTVPDKEILIGMSITFITLFLIDTVFLHNKYLFLLRHIFKPLHRTLPYGGFFFILIITGIIIARNFFPEWKLFSDIAFDLKDLSDARYYTDIPNFFEAFLLEWNPLVFSLTPVVLFGFFSLWIPSSQKKGQHQNLIPFAILFFFLVYTLLLIYSNILSTPRYSIMLYPLFAFLASLGFRSLLQKIPLSFASPLLATLAIISSIFILSQSKPFYFNYTNFLLPKDALINDAWGYGGYEAAQYLNSLPHASDLTVWVDYYGVCEFFIGKCLSAYTFDPAVVSPDYYVLTRRGEIRYRSRASRWERLSGLTAYKYYDLPNPDWQLIIGDRPGNFIRVVRVDKVKRSEE